LNARYYTSATAAISTGSTTVLEYPTKDYDTHGIMSGTGTSQKFTVPIAGKYRISGIIKWQGSSTGVRDIIVRKNGSTDYTLFEAQNLGSGTVYTSGSITLQLAAGDFVAMACFQNSGGNLNAGSSSGTSDSYMSIERIGN
jgi:hypothetical protein